LQLVFNRRRTRRLPNFLKSSLKSDFVQLLLYLAARSVFCLFSRLSAALPVARLLHELFANYSYVMTSSASSCGYRPDSSAVMLAAFVQRSIVSHKSPIFPHSSLMPSQVNAYINQIVSVFNTRDINSFACLTEVSFGGNTN
jgi:hypothetical protein